jgi:hypothetical protein
MIIIRLVIEECIDHSIMSLDKLFDIKDVFNNCLHPYFRLEELIALRSVSKRFSSIKTLIKYKPMFPHGNIVNYHYTGSIVGNICIDGTGYVFAISFSDAFVGITYVKKFDNGVINDAWNVDDLIFLTSWLKDRQYDITVHVKLPHIIYDPETPVYYMDGYQLLRSSGTMELELTNHNTTTTVTQVLQYSNMMRGLSSEGCFFENSTIRNVGRARTRPSNEYLITRFCHDLVSKREKSVLLTALHDSVTTDLSDVMDILRSI